MCLCFLDDFLDAWKCQVCEEDHDEVEIVTLTLKNGEVIHRILCKECIERMQKYVGGR